VSVPRNAPARLRRLLVMLPWLMEAGEVTLAEVASRFDMSEADVSRDLELVAMCGLPPYVDEMVDVFIDDGVVFVGVPRLFTRPLRLTAPEGFSLLAAARAAMELPGADPSGPLARGLDKLAKVLGQAGLETGDDTAGDDTAGVVVDLARPTLADELAAAAGEAAELSISYYAPARDDVTARTIVPRHVFTERGNWYVRADDDRSGQVRTFRIDRIESVAQTGRTSPSDHPVEVPDRFFDDADLPRATIGLAPEAQWIIDQYPVDDVAELPDGWVAVTLPVASERWLSRLLIRLGPGAQVRSPRGALDRAGELAATVLDRYGSGGQHRS
jgi:proteasome accessory factor C